jgi:hypothetical protein
MATAVQSKLHRLEQTRRRYGAKATLHYLLARSCEKLLKLEVSKLIVLNAADLPPAIPLDPEFTFRFLTPGEVAQFAVDPRNQLDPAFADRASGNFDFCFAALHHAQPTENESKTNKCQLASYSWYALNSIEGRHHVGVPMSLPADMAYMYNAFTQPEFRGRRLYGAGIALALKALAERGITRLVTSINTSNFSSLASCRRLGFRELGRLYTFGRGEHRRAMIPRAAKQLGIKFNTLSSGRGPG